MNTTDSQTEIVALYAELHSVLDRISVASSTPASDLEVIEAAESHERAVKRMSWIGHRRVLDVSDRAAHIKAGYRSLYAFMAARLRITNPTRRRRHMEAVAQMYSMQGELLPPACPATAAALAEGAVGPDHVEEILKTLRHIPSSVSTEDKVAAESQLAQHAREFDPATVARLGAQVIAHLDPDGSLTDDRDRARRRSLSLGKQDPQSMSTLSGTLDPITRAMFDTLLDAWAAPGMNNPDDESSPRGGKVDADSKILKEAARQDMRSQSKRNHDALTALLKAALGGGVLGKSHRGLPPHLIVKITESELRERAGLGETAGGAHLPIKDVIELAAEAQHHLAVFADHSPEILYLGEAQRLANQSQRFALFARDGAGCTCPDCTQPFTRLEIHHAERDWADGGWTDVSDLAGACPKHNRMVGPKVGQWTTHIIREGPDTGRPAWTLNSDGTGPPNSPRVNRIHHVGENLDRLLRGVSPPPTIDSRREDMSREERRRVQNAVSMGWLVRAVRWEDLGLAG
ncbi:HNH endonuclease signature motif containing protein [Gordonia sp. SL306]|uniref:HNH endonuclease signature motif containing protein n=1 Tax=Gordonia sp. SL306 TaxID=2995145 RepID=UPI00226DEB42|nr:HNH endonuclease signature motif containing protein [Gordonia sp. SL306]WAC57542.1 DUF222 domain-containing protein [Gordonia sp. SL306]